jgi:hypothetical protein
MDAERLRLQEARDRGVPWKKWGPYLSERQWGTVREDYSETGNAWDYFTHDQARSRAYRWGEDGLAGVSDDKQLLCFALALWNGADPILKERLFGLTNGEGNHGEDVKEYYFYLDSTPTHSYCKCLYKYPQAAYPYNDLVRTNRQRSRYELEYELLDTGIFDQDRYFDVFVEYAKESPEDVLIAITVCNRGPEAATIHVLPTLWFRNTWSWSDGAPKPGLRQIEGPSGITAIEASHPELGHRYLYCDGDVALLFTENETNTERLFNAPNRTPYVKDGINDCVVHGRREAVTPERRGTKAAAHWRTVIGAGESRMIRLRLTPVAPSTLGATYPDASGGPFGSRFDDVLRLRQDEADAFYRGITPETIGEDAKNIVRQALAGMLWSKQYYDLDVYRWLKEHGISIGSAIRQGIRNRQWFHMINDDVISMPDKWEYPWYAAWDLAFHTIVLAMVDLDLAKQQLDLMLTELYMHPNGQIPAYEWNFGDVNPPVQATAALYVYNAEKALRGQGDVPFLERSFQKLLLNFTWWVNRKDPNDRNVFEGGFLGLDNIGVFDRSAPLPTGGHLEQADGTAWMALFSMSMLEIALELALHDPVYESLAVKFADHTWLIAAAMGRLGGHSDGMWDEEDGFFYDVLRLPDGTSTRLRVRSLVGLLPLCATTVFPKEIVERYPTLMQRVRRRLALDPEMLKFIGFSGEPGVAGRRIFAILDEGRLRRILARMLDEREFLSPYGIRSISRYHAEHPFSITAHGEEYRVAYEPAESASGTFGGNSNWRGPIWFPLNLLILRGLLQFYAYLGDAFTVEYPTGSGQQMTLFQVVQDIGLRLTRIFLRDEHGRRPVYGGAEKFQTDPRWRDLLLFYEYFHGDNGAGIGASHQTGWTGLVARLIEGSAVLSHEGLLEPGSGPAAFLYGTRGERAQVK